MTRTRTISVRWSAGNAYPSARAHRSSSEAWFPVCSSRLASKQASFRRTRSSRSKEPNMRALVIDDSRAMRMIIGRILQECGMEVVEACDGADGLEKLKQA